MFRTSTQLTTIRTTSTPTTTTTRNPRSNSDLRPYVLSTDHLPRRHHTLRRDVTILVKMRLQSRLWRLRHHDMSTTYSEDQDDIPDMDMDVNNNVEDVSEDVSEDAAD